MDYLLAACRIQPGPFTKTRELIAGYWLWQVRSLEEAIEWARRCPNPTAAEGEIEIRPVYELVDFSDAVTPELHERNERLRAATEPGCPPAN